MVYNIIIGRDEEERKKFEEIGTIFLGKSYVKMGQTVSLSNNVYVDVNKPHVILVAGKRGSGKSTTLGVMAEEMARLPEEINKNLAFLFFDTMGVFWTMKYPNKRQEDLLAEWNMKPEELNINLYCPKGKFEIYKEKGIPADKSFSIRTSELNANDWLNVFDLKHTEPIGILIQKIIMTLEGDYDIKRIIEAIKKDEKSENYVKDACENMFMAADSWGLFDKEGTRIKDLVKSGEVTVLDISAYNESSIKSLVIGIVCRKLMEERMLARKKEEMESIEYHGKYFSDDTKLEEPLVWILVDETHEFLPNNKKTAATDALISLLREGRQPGISLVLATQQPGVIHSDVLTQADIVISHRLTSKIDIDALNSMMQSYLLEDLQEFLNDLPDLKGSAIVLDDNSERIYPIRVHPKRSWHGGESPSAIKESKKIELEI